MSSFGQRLQQQFAERGQLCVGIDPSSSQLGSWGLPDNAVGAREFSFTVLEAAAGVVGIVKPQVAFFEQFGTEGFRVLEEILQRAKSLGLLIIADAKRGDIGSSMDGYSKAWLSQAAPFFADALTLSPYLGVDSLSETLDSAVQAGKGVFILAATSNSEARPMQSAKQDNQSVSASVVEFAARRNKESFGSVGVVIGATVALRDYGISEHSLRNTPVLMPGFGQQGAELSLIHQSFPESRASLICNVSRSVAGQSRDGIVERIALASDQLHLGLTS